MLRACAHAVNSGRAGEREGGSNRTRRGLGTGLTVVLHGVDCDAYHGREIFGGKCAHGLAGWLEQDRRDCPAHKALARERGKRGRWLSTLLPRVQKAPPFLPSVLATHRLIATALTRVKALHVPSFPFTPTKYHSPPRTCGSALRKVAAWARSSVGAGMRGERPRNSDRSTR